jgi:hypothetical protein
MGRFYAMERQRAGSRVVILAVLAVLPGRPSEAGVDGPRAEIDPHTLRGKVLCGYQGWFRCPGDASGQGWRHWSRDGSKITSESLTVEMWPDMTELTSDERYPVPGFTNPDGTPASLFSSDNARTVGRHFEWMADHDIDGVLVQRFLVNVGDPSFDRVLGFARDAANRTGRVFAVCYDMTGTPEDRIDETLSSDWKKLVDASRLTDDPRYLHHDGKPVVMVWGFFSDRFGAAVAHRIIDFFHADGPYAATLIGGCPWHWRAERDPEWARAYRRFDVISPWNVGNHVIEDGRKQAATATWKDDRDEARRAGMEFLPVIYPGFGWTNLKGPQAASESIPRLGGDFYWRQFAEAADLSLDMAYVAMFDEVDEATAIFKVTNTPPTPGRFQTFEGRPADWYLRLTGAGASMLRGEIPRRRAIPIEP